MNFLSVLYAKAGITVDGVTTLNNTATGLTPATNDNSTKLATTAFVKNQNYYPYPTGTTAQYVRGDGSLATFTQTGGGGSSVSYYLNGGTSQGTIGGNTYYEMSKTAVVGTNADFSINANGYVAQFVTDAGDPALLNIPGGNWNFEMFFSASSGGGSPSFYVELYKYDGTTLTLIASGSAIPESITGGTSTDLYVTALAVPTTTLTLTDRLAVRVYVTHSGRTITLHTQNGHLCQIITTFTTGLTALNGLTAQVQNFAVGAGGSDFNISSVTDTHTFNLPTASATKRGALSSIDWSAFDAKVDFGDLSATSPLNYNGSGVFSIAQSSTSTNGYLSSTDWTAFNNKQNALTNPVTGTGTTNYLPKFTGTSALGNSLFQETTNAIGLGITPSAWSGFKALEIGAVGNSLWSAGSNDIRLNTNYVFDVSGKYAGTGFATQYQQTVGQHRWFTAPSGTAGNAITFTQAMSLLANGNLLIGTTTDAGYKLDVNGTTRVSGAATFVSTITASQGLFTSGSSLAGVIVKGSSSNQGVLQFGDANTNFQIQGGSDYSGMLFKVGSVERMRIVLASGNVLINTTTDSGGYKLNVNGTANFSNSVTISTANNINPADNVNTVVVGNVGDAGWRAKGIGGSAAANHNWTIAHNALKLYFGISNGVAPDLASWLVVSPSGAVEFTSLAGSGSRMVVADATGALSTQAIPTSAITGGGTTNYITKWTGGTAIGDSIIYDNGTYVGIGTTSPSEKLSVVNGSISTKDNAAYDSAFIEGANGIAYIGALGTTSEIALYNGGSTKVTIKPISGNVGIGTTSPTHKVHINSTDDDTYALRVQGNTNNVSGVWTGIGLAGEGTNTKVGILFEDVGVSYSRGKLIFAVNNAADQTNATPANAVMTLMPSGNVLIGTTTDSGYKLTIAGNSNSYSVNPHASGIDIYSTGNIAPHYQTTYTWYTGAIGAGTFRMGLDASGNLTASSFIKSGGTSAQFLKANGSVDSSAYISTLATITGNIDSDYGECFVTFDPVPSGTPPLSSPNIRTINVGNSYSRRTQLAFDYASDTAFFRRRTEAGWFAWREFIHSGNIGSQSVNYSTTAGSTTLLVSPNGATVVAADSAMPSQGQSFIHTLALGPGADDGHILGMTWANTTTIYGAQIWLDTDPSKRMAIRNRSNSGTWTSWAEVLTDSNYNSYSPTLTGGGASGTWGINVTGISDLTAGIQAYFLGTNSVNVNTATTSVFRNENGAGAVLSYAPVLHVAASDTMWQLQGTYGTTGNGTLYFRQGYNGSWGTWLTMISSANISSYLSGVYLPLTGGTLTGTLNGTRAVFSTAINNNYGLSVTNTGTTGAGGLYVNIGTSATGAPIRVDKAGVNIFLMSSTGNITMAGDLAVDGGDIIISSSGGANVFTRYQNGTGNVEWRLAASVFTLVDNVNEISLMEINPTTAGTFLYYPSLTINTSNTSGGVLLFKATLAANTWGIYKNDTTGLTITKNSVTQLGISATGAITLINTLSVTGGYIEVGQYGLSSSTYSAYIRRNDVSSYGAWDITGGKGGYTGALYNTTNLPHIMFGTTNGFGGLYYQTGSRWVLYYNYTDNCLAVGGTTTNATYKMYVTGAIYATGAIVANSDGRNKENVEVVENALEKVTNLRGVTYTKKDQDSGKREMGVIAQEVEPHVPEVVHHSKDADIYGVSYGNFAGLFIEAIKEQQVLINELQAKIEILEKNK